MYKTLKMLSSMMLYKTGNKNCLKSKCTLMRDRKSYHMGVKLEIGITTALDNTEGVEKLVYSAAFS